MKTILTTTLPVGLMLLQLCSMFSTIVAVANQPVAVLTVDNYTTFLENNKVVLVEFMAPWCGHCRKMGKEYINAASTLQRMNSPTRLATIDASSKENHGIVDDANVEGYPSFLLYRNGRHVLSYGGLRTEAHFVEYMLQRNAPLITPIDSLQELWTFLGSHFGILDNVNKGQSGKETHYFFVGMMPSTSMFESFHDIIEDVSAHNDDSNVHFLMTDSEAIMGYFLVPDNSFQSFSVASVMLTTGDNVADSYVNSIVRHDIASRSDLQNFVMTSCAATVLPFQSENLHVLRNTFSPKNQVLVFCHDSEPIGEACLETVNHIAPEYRGTFLFVTISHQELHLYHTFGIKIGSPHPQIVILNITNEHDLKKYVLDHETYSTMAGENSEVVEGVPPKSLNSFTLTEDRLRQFLDMYIAHELRPFYRSEESVTGTMKQEQSQPSTPEGVVGETDEERSQRELLLPIRVTSKTLRERVIDNTESVLLFITASWCGHCKSLEPVIRSLAKLLHQRKRKNDLSATGVAATTTGSAIPSLAGLPVSNDVVETRVEAGARDDVIVAHIDGSVNDVHSLGDIDVNGFPTIVFLRYVDGMKVAVEYTGERTVKDLLQYIHKNGVPLTTTTHHDEL